MTEANPQCGTRIEIWARDYASYEAMNIQETVYNQLQQIKDEGTITDISMNVWGRQINAVAVETMEGFVSPANEAIDTFETWASEHKYSLQPAFERREIGSLVMDETQDIVVPPIICLAVYDGDELQAVFPHSDGEKVHTVSDFLDRLMVNDDRPTADKPGIKV